MRTHSIDPALSNQTTHSGCFGILASPNPYRHCYRPGKVENVRPSCRLVFQSELSREDALVRSLHPEDLDTMLKRKGF
jgi:hypothetical protein